MRKGTRGRYTLEYKQDAVRLVESGQTMAAARSLGVVEQTLGNWIREHRKDATLTWLLWYNQTRMRSTPNYLSRCNWNRIGPIR